MSTEGLHLNVLCNNSTTDSKRGRLVLPFEFYDKYRNKITEKVYAFDTSNTIWTGKFVKDGGYIEGLETLMQSYGLQNSHVILLKFNGKNTFGINIFNNDGVQIGFQQNNAPEDYKNLKTITNSMKLGFNNSNVQDSVLSPVIAEDLAKTKIMFWHKVDEDVKRTGILAIPKSLLKELGTHLDTGVALWMADRNVWIASYCKQNNCFSGLKRMLDHYSVLNGWSLLFQYVGKSTFYLSIFTPNSVDVLNDIKPSKKLLLREVVIPQTCYRKKACSKSSHYIRPEIPGQLLNNQKTNKMLEDHSQGRGRAKTNIEEMIVTLSKAHVDSKCHGVYCPTSLKTFYKNWTIAKDIKLRCRGEEWTVKANKFGKRARFGKGWSKFTTKNSLEIGDRLRFVFTNGRTLRFDVTVLKPSNRN